MKTISDYDSILSDGLTTSKTYVKILTKTRTPVTLQFKPVVYRTGPFTVRIGGKLSIFWNDNQNSTTSPNNRKASMEKLFDMPFFKSDSRRVGTELYTVVALDQKSYETAKELVVKPEFVSDIVTYIEQTFDAQLENRRQVVGAIKAFYVELLKPLFTDTAEVSLSEKDNGQDYLSIVNIAEDGSGEAALSDFESSYMVEYNAKIEALNKAKSKTTAPQADDEDDSWDSDDDSDDDWGDDWGDDSDDDSDGSPDEWK